MVQAQVEIEVSKRKQRLEEIKEFSKHQQDFADKIIDLLGEGKVANYAKVCRLATYMSTVPTSAEVRAGWKEFLGDMSILLKIAEAKQLADSKGVNYPVKHLAQVRALTSDEKIELEELKVLQMHDKHLSIERAQRLSKLRMLSDSRTSIMVPDDLYGTISKRRARQEVTAQATEVPLPEMLNLSKTQGDDS